MSDRSEWSPYGLEAIRIAHLRRRRALGIVALLGASLLAMAMMQTTTTSSFDISVNGQSGGNGISLDIPDEQPRNGPVTVSLTPGRVTRAETGSAAPTSTVQRNEVPGFSRAPAYNFAGLILLAAPWALIAGAAWLLGRRRGKHDEVNYGIYKGAMPLELITASASRQVFTRKHARASLFGRRRMDHLPGEVIASERLREDR